jgi:hypothetical protein
MRNLRLVCLLSAALLPAAVAAQSAAVDTSKIGPKVGAVAPAFSGTDQNGRTVSLASAAGPKGTMLVFFRSADW